MALSTAGNDGRVSSRMVLLKGRDSRGFVFFSNYESRKGDNRLHHRTEYTLHNSVWHIRRLAP